MSTQAAPNPALVAAVEAHAAARRAHHEAGHAVAAVARGGELVDVFLGTTDWSTFDSTADTPGGTVHRAAWAAQPFVTFAGPWAEARWTVENDPDVAGIHEALEFAWSDNADGDTAKYESRVEMLSGVAVQLGFGPVGRVWELECADDLELLWPAICKVAAVLIDGQPVTHDIVRELVK